MNFGSRFSRVLALASVSSLAMTAAAFAQTVVQDPTETVTVTGSRILQDAASSPTPLTVVSSQELLANTPTNLMDGLKPAAVQAYRADHAIRPHGHTPDEPPVA